MSIAPMVGPHDLARSAIRWAARNYREAKHRLDTAFRIAESHPDNGPDAPHDAAKQIERWTQRASNAFNMAEMELALAIHTAGGAADEGGSVDDEDLMVPRAVIVGGEVYATFWIEGRSDPVVVAVGKDRVVDFDRKRRG